MHLQLILGSDETQPVVVQIPHLKGILMMINVHYGRWQHLLFPFTEAILIFSLQEQELLLPRLFTI